jgi:hypothetical protein
VAKGYSRTSRNGIYRRRSEIYWRRRRGAAPSSRNPIYVDITPVDIVVTPVTPTRQKVADVEAVEVTTSPTAVTQARGVAAPIVQITRTIPALDPAKIVDADPVDATVQPAGLDPAKVFDLTPVDITAQPVAPDPAKIFDLNPVGSTVQPVTPTVVILPIVRPTPKDVTVQPVVPKVAKVYDVDPVDITVSPVVPTLRRVLDVDPVDVGIQVGEAAAAGQTPTVDVAVQPLAVKVGRVFDVDPVDITVTPMTRTGVKIVDADPTDVTAAPAPVKTGRGYRAPAVDVTTTPVVPARSKIVDVAPTDTTIQAVGVDPAKINDPNPVDITRQLPRVTPYTFDGKPRPVTVQPAAPRAAKIVKVPIVTITTAPVVLDPAKVSKPAPKDIVAAPRPPTAYSASMDPPEIVVEPLPVQVLFGADKSAAHRDVRPWPKVHPARVLAQNILSREWVHLDLPLSDLEIEYVLSGAQRISGNFPVEIRDLRDANLEPWGTWIHVEVEGEIRASGILMPTEVDTGQKLGLEAVGVSQAPKGIPYLGPDFDMVKGDPADVVRMLWAHLQAYPGADLGVVVRGITGYQLGEATPPDNVDFVTDTGEQVSFTSGGPYKLREYEATDCGSEISKLAGEAPFDYVERQRWHNWLTKDYVEHFVDIGWPRAGRRRENVLFSEANILTPVGPGELDDQYVSEVHVLGKGEGSSRIRGYAGRPLGTRIRRVRMIDDKTVDNAVRANAMAREELERAQALLDIQEFTAKARHVDAPIGSFDVGDDVPIDIEVPWLGRVRQWERVTSIAYSPDQEVMKIGCRRSETWNYGGAQ